MSDDEYFGDDDIFTAAELDNIPLLNEPPPSASGERTAVFAEPPPPATPNTRAGTSATNSNGVARAIAGPSQNFARNGSAQHNRGPGTGPAGSPMLASSSRGPGAQAAPVRRTGSRLSTIMNALRAGQDEHRSSQPVGGPRHDVFGPPTGLLQTPKRDNRHVHSGLQKASSSSGIAGPSRQSSQKSTFSSPKTGSKRRRSSSSTRSVDSETADRIIREETWSVMEEELNCVICCDVYVAPQITFCGHSACAPCLKSWLARNSNCPICRTYLNAAQKPCPNLLASSMIDRLFLEASKHQLSDWCPGGVKRVEWDKRKRAWDLSVAQAAAEAARLSRINTRSVTTARQRQYRAQPLFLPPGDDDYDYDHEYDRYYDDY